MSSQGFGVNPGKTFTTTDLPLPVGVGSVGKTQTALGCLFKLVELLTSTLL